MFTRTVIEVGANQGQDTEKFLAEPGTLLYAFEPVPDLAFDLSNKYFNRREFRLINAAVDLENGWREFNVATEGDWGCSSFYEYKEGVCIQRFTKHLMNVLCIRLDTFMDLWGIEKVDYIHIDAQGNDFRVLQSLGDRIKDVEDGVVEVSNKMRYYEGTDDNHVDVVKPWLEERGFSVRVEDDGVGKHMASVTGNEVNLFFTRNK